MQKAGWLRAEAVFTQRPALSKGETSPLWSRESAENTLMGRGYSIHSPQSRSKRCRQYLPSVTIGAHHSHLKTSAGVPPYFLLRPAAFLSAAVQSLCFVVFQLFQVPLLLETWDIKEKMKEYKCQGNGNIITTRTAHVQTRCSEYPPIKYLPTLKHHLEVVRMALYYELVIQTWFKKLYL